MATGKIASDKRRFFIQHGDSFRQILSFNQHEDGSIYCSMPEFASAKWLSFRTSKGDTAPTMVVVNSPEEMGKFSMHGSGMLTFRANKNPRGHTLIIKGHPLVDTAKGKIGVRHLFTYFPSEPQHIPNSPAFNRQSDFVLKKTDQLKPFAMVFFAIPYKPDLTANIGASFHESEIDIPPDAAVGTFGLRYHNVSWFYYRTKNMDHWPENTLICYFNGYHTPLFIGSGAGQMRVDLREPKYEFVNNEILIKM